MQPDTYCLEKETFFKALTSFAESLSAHIATNDEWTIKGFIDVFHNIYSVSSDTKIISKVLELHLFPHFVAFAEEYNYTLELASCQNWYPDLTFISREDPRIKFAVDLKTTYRDENHPGFCNGFTLGSHGEYFIDRNSTKNIQYPYNSYLGHYCLGIIYSRIPADPLAETKTYTLEELPHIPSTIHHFTFLLKKNGALPAIVAVAETPQISEAYKT